MVPAGTKLDVYPAKSADLDTPVSKLVANPVVFEARLKGPVFAPAVVNVISAVAIFIDYLELRLLNMFYPLLK